MSAILLRDALADELGKLIDATSQKILLGKCATLEEYKSECCRVQAYNKALKIATDETKRLHSGGVRADSVPAQQRATGR